MLITPEEIKKARELAEKSSKWDENANCAHYLPCSTGPDEYVVGPQTFPCNAYTKGFGDIPEQAELTSRFIAFHNPEFIIRILDSYEALKAERDRAVEVIRFYGEQSHWGGYHRHVHEMMADDYEQAKCRFDNFEISLAGKRAREFLKGIQDER